MYDDILIVATNRKELAENWEKLKVLVRNFILISYAFMAMVGKKRPPHALLLITLCFIVTKNLWDKN